MTGPIANLVSLALLAGCGSPTATGDARRLPAGSWGGNHIALEVAAGGATVELDCAHGAITAPITLDSDGRFEIGGTYVQERGGPVREGEEDARPARYAGRVDGQTMTLSITLSDVAETLGPYELTRGRAARLTKCL